MKILTFPYLHKLQHYTKRNPPWLKNYAAVLGPKFVSPREDAEVVAYAKLVWELSDHAKLLLQQLELLASRQDPVNQLPYNLGWIAAELAGLACAQRPRMLAALLDELLAVALAESLDVTSITTARHLPLARASAPLDSSGTLSLPGEGCGEGPDGRRSLDDELPADLRGVSPDLLLAVERYGIAATKAGWPGVRQALLRDMQDEFESMTERMKALDVDFDWLICFHRATEQAFIAGIPGFGFEWFLRCESKAPHRPNALKVWDYAFVSRREMQADRNQFGDFRDTDQDFSRSRSGYVLRWRGSTVPSVGFPQQQRFGFAEVYS